ncbi:MAG: hypothetical protein GY759_16780 [Chloroflexi bacterium]|nr:hypothetical protein [Chloroflexota bacterium]
MRDFDHVGLPTDDVQPGEMWVEETRVWVTNPQDHPYKVECLRYEPDSPVTGPVRNQPHIAFQVPNLEEAMGDSPVLLGPFDANENLRVVFVLKDGAVFEYMESKVGKDWHTA